MSLLEYGDRPSRDLPSGQLITVENQSTVVDERVLFNAVWAVNYQLSYHYGRSPWVSERLAPRAHLLRLPAGMKPPAGAWHIILLDTSDQAGALGYHDDETGTGIPYSDVFCKDSLADGATVSAVLSHETLEMIVDPYVDPARTRVAKRDETNQLYIVEVGDPVQGNDYDVGAPEGRETGVLVADFALPAWWKLGAWSAGGPFSYRRSIGAPWEIAPKGYMSIAPADQPDQWSQIFGPQAEHRPDPDDLPADGRLHRLRSLQAG